MEHAAKLNSPLNTSVILANSLKLVPVANYSTLRTIKEARLDKEESAVVVPVKQQS